MTTSGYSFAKLGASAVIEQLQLEKHPTEGGYFRRTYESDARCVNAAGAERHTMTSIYYMLTSDSSEGCWHKNASDIMHYFHGGGVIEYWVVAPEGEAQRVTLGGDLAKGQCLQFCVPGGYWKYAKLIEGEFCLLSEAVSPGFDFADNQLASTEQVAAFNAKFDALELG